jgi:uridine kinase
MESPSPDHTFIAALSGASSSGKSTLARLLRSIFNIALPDRTLKLFILHEDDFYKPDDQIPVRFGPLYICPIISLPISTDQDVYFSEAW